MTKTDAFVTVLIVAIIATSVIFLIHMNIESGKYHHKMRVGDLIDYLSPYTDCYIAEEVNNPNSSRLGGVIVSLVCQK